MATNPPQTEPKAQHYVPKFYLKGFTDKQHALWVYEQFKPLRESKPKKEAQRPDYYTHAEDGERDERAENALQGAEWQAAPIIRKLANPMYVLTQENAAHLTVFVALMFARVPSWREYLNTLAGQVIRHKLINLANDKETFHKLCSGLESKRGRPYAVNLEELREYWLQGEFQLEQTSKAFNLKTMFRSAITIMGILRDFGQQILYAPQGKYFMTSDAPVYTLKPEPNRVATVGIGFGWPGVEVYFPLNKRACLRMAAARRAGRRTIEGGHVDEINHLVMATATKYLYSSERFRRTSRLFDERGCKVRTGKSAFLPTPPSEYGRLF